MTPERRVIVYPDKQTLADSLAARFLTKVRKVIAARGEATIVLTGGTMGYASLAAINASPERDTVDWSAVNFWWGDERWLPDADPERNETQAREALLAHIPVDPERVHAFPASDGGLELDEAADAYAAELKAAAPDGADYPAFDITFLGVGPDDTSPPCSRIVGESRRNYERSSRFEIRPNPRRSDSASPCP